MANIPDSQNSPVLQHSNPAFPLETELRNEIENSKLPVLVAISADWCGTCHIMSPVLAELAEEWQRRIRLITINIETNEQIAREFGVTELPFLLFFSEGRIVDHVIGLASKAELEERIEAVVKCGFT